MTGPRPALPRAPDPRVRLLGGRLFDPWAGAGPTPPPAAAFRAAANLCRYGGHVTRYYSVAEHTLWLTVAAVAGPDLRAAARLAGLLKSRSPRWPDELMRACRRGGGAALSGLLSEVHDLPEALGLVDLPAPVKYRPEMAPYRAADLRLLGRVCAAWGLPPPLGLGAAHAEPQGRVWDKVWAIDLEARAAEEAIRPPRDPEEPPAGTPWPWLDLAGAHALDDGGETAAPGARTWVVRALCEAWDALRVAADMPHVAPSGGGEWR